MKTRADRVVPILVVCFLFLPTSSGCTTFDGLTADQDLSPTTAGANEPGRQVSCQSPSDCQGSPCLDHICANPTSRDGLKDGTETDVDCGGGPPTNAARCDAGKACIGASDCFWGHCTSGLCEGHSPGQKDGDQTDIDCGGKVSPACDWEKSCLVDGDCTSTACGDDKKCLTGPSCRTLHGGATCGTEEFGNPGRKHESCCRSLEVVGYADPRQPGKRVFLDKYEITAGRMRTFVESVAAANGGVPNIQAYMAAHRPARWSNGWENTLPAARAGATATFAVTTPTVDPLSLYPGNDKYDGLIGTWSIVNGAYTIDPSLNFALGASHFFPEYYAPPPWPSTDYGATHNLNCSNTRGSYGTGTYWMDAATIAASGGGVGKYFSQEEMDEKALNCAPFGLFAAFCAADGGQLMTTEVFDYVAGGPWPPNPATAGVPTPPRLTGGNTLCGAGLNTFPDGTQSCPNVYFYPNDMGNDQDGSSRIAPPGRVAADAVAINVGDEPWMDLKGNLHEAVLRPDGMFSYRGYGVGWSSVTAHLPQTRQPRMKGGSFGARCMRFKASGT